MLQEIDMSPMTRETCLRGVLIKFTKLWTTNL